jgi:hypothetical protein
MESVVNVFVKLLISTFKLVYRILFVKVAYWYPNVSIVYRILLTMSKIVAFAERNSDTSMIKIVAFTFVSYPAHQIDTQGIKL